MYFSPFTKQIFVASAPQLAAISVGATTPFPAVLLHQLQSNYSPIQLDPETASWIASVHGLAGTLSIVMPTIMQIKGRKVALILSTIVVLIGWTLLYFANNVAAVIAGECLHGVGSNMFHMVGLLAISEMVTPSIRNVSMPLMNVNLIMGMALASISGCFFHWKTVCLICIVPLIIAMAITFFWPESPFWLAQRSEFEECERAFNWLRGSDERSQKELAALIKAQRDTINSVAKKSHIRKWSLKELIQKVTRRDFYLPCLHVTVIISTYYWSGPVATYIFTSDLVEKTTKNKDAAFLAVIIVSLAVIIGALILCFANKYFNNKTIILSSCASCIVFLISGTIVTFCQKVGVIPEDSMLFLYCLVGVMISNTSGWLELSYSISAEIMPVKHRGLGGMVYLVVTCILHSIPVKVSGDMLRYLDVWGTYLVYSISAIVGFLFIWKFVPETKGRTLQEIEYFYNHGSFAECLTTEEDVNLVTRVAVNP